MGERRIDQRRRRTASVEPLADQAERPLADPVGAAFVADDVAPPADAIGRAGGVPRPRHRAGAGQDEDAGAAGKRADMGAVDIVDDRLRHTGKGIGDRGALAFGEEVDFAVRGKRRADRGQPRRIGEGAELAGEFLPPVAIVHRVDAAAARQPDDAAAALGERNDDLAAAAVDAEEQLVGHGGDPIPAIVVATPASASCSAQWADRRESVMTLAAAASGATL